MLLATEKNKTKHNPYLAFLLFLVALGLVVLMNIYIYLPEKIPIDTATDKQLYITLVEVDGIGPILAQRVVRYRQEHKPIKMDELIYVDGIGEKRLKMIKKVVKNEEVKK